MCEYLGDCLKKDLDIGSHLRRTSCVLAFIAFTWLELKVVAIGTGLL